MKKLLIITLLAAATYSLNAEDGYRLWLRYDKITNSALLNQYKSLIKSPTVLGNSPTLSIASRELNMGLTGLLATPVTVSNTLPPATTLVVLRVDHPQQSYISKEKLPSLNEEGFHILSTANPKRIIIIANSDIGLLYGVYHFLKLLQTNQSIQSLNIVSNPKTNLRILNHWDNLNRTVERGYAGFSIWDWHTLPDLINQRYIDYARANASIGINGTVLTNVNANAMVLTKPYLEKVAALANTFRPYGIKVYLTARFSAPIEIGKLKTADPLSDSVRNWWKSKADEIYQLIPDFGGFLVKANSEGQPGPQNYGRTHVDGANMLADAVAPHNGIVMWRAFVYSAEVKEDRHKQAYNEFVPLDGKFKNNVMVQVKNGAIDFMPREPFHPLFGAMPKTPLMMEFQVTQEYLGQGTNLCFLAPMYKECLDSDTYSKGAGSTVAKVVDGSLDNHSLNGIAGVANIGNDINWTGHPFGQANWYALGRLAWDHQLTSDQIADEWIRMTYNNDRNFVADIKQLMLGSRETVVSYSNPIGLHHLMATGHHYGPGPWVNNLTREDWNPVYYHKADSAGIGFDRTAKGSNALSQYAPEARMQWEDVTTIDEKYLLWFHHVSWAHKMKSGRTLWNELCFKYNSGVDSVRKMRATWIKQKNKIDEERFNHVLMLLNIQEKEAVWWRDACLLYFQTFSRMPIPVVYEKPAHTLEYYKSLRFPYAPGN